MFSTAKEQLSSLNVSGRVGACVCFAGGTSVFSVLSRHSQVLHPFPVMRACALQRDGATTLAAVWWPDSQHAVELELISR